MDSKDLKDFASQLDMLTNKLRRRQISGSFQIAYRTVMLIRTFVSTSKWKNAGELVRKIKEVGRDLYKANATEVSSTCMIRRILHVIRTECNSVLLEQNNAESASKYVGAGMSGLQEEPEEEKEEEEEEELGDEGNEGDVGNRRKSSDVERVSERFAQVQLQTSGGLAGSGGNFNKKTAKVNPYALTRESSASSQSDLDFLGIRPTVPHSNSLQNLLMRTSSANSEAEDIYSIAAYKIKHLIIEELNEILRDVESCSHNISDQAMDHIHSNEVIMTMGMDNVEAFLKTAKRKRKFQVVVVEGAPSFMGQKFAASLSQEGIECTVISDAAVCALMSRVNKVIIGTHAVVADGGLMAMNGARSLALAASYHSVPCIVLAPMYKLCPEYICSYDLDTFNHMESPQGVLGFQKSEIVGKVAILNPTYEYVEPELISLFVTNIGGYAPSYVYRLLSEYYTMDADEDLNHDIGGEVIRLE
eukprot:Nk52_evm15s2340 gene=Nk52_evmTU15s2340